LPEPKGISKRETPDLGSSLVGAARGKRDLRRSKNNARGAAGVIRDGKGNLEAGAGGAGDGRLLLILVRALGRRRLRRQETLAALARHRRRNPGSRSGWEARAAARGGWLLLRLEIGFPVQIREREAFKREFSVLEFRIGCAALLVFAAVFWREIFGAWGAVS
jgi:hypothetical protein